MNSEKLRKMASYWLDQSADKYSNHGCNDLPSEFIEQCGLTDEEKIEFVTDMYTRNGDLQDRLHYGGPIKAKDFNSMPDWWVMRYLANKLGEPNVEDVH